MGDSAARAPGRVLHVVPARPFGGLQKVAAELALAQRAAGVAAQVLAVYEGARFNAYCKSRGLQVNSTREPPFSPLAWLDLSRGLRDVRPNLVHLHVGLLWSNSLGLVLKDQPWVYHGHLHVDPPSDLKSRMQVEVLRRLCDVYIGVSDWVSESIRSVIRPSKAPIHTVPNGLPLPPREAMRDAGGEETNVARYGMATRFAEDKGALEFVRVAAAIAELDADAEFVLAGEGPLEPAVRERARDWGIAERLKLPGFVSDINRFWTSLDVALFTAPREAFGLSLIEPMGLGVPVAAYRTGAGSDEVVDNGRTGMMVPSGDQVALARASVRLAHDRELAARLTSHARERVEARFSVDAMIDNVAEVYTVALQLDH